MPAQSSNPPTPQRHVDDLDTEEIETKKNALVITSVERLNRRIKAQEVEIQELKTKLDGVLTLIPELKRLSRSKTSVVGSSGTTTARDESPIGSDNHTGDLSSRASFSSTSGQLAMSLALAVSADNAIVNVDSNKNSEAAIKEGIKVIPRPILTKDLLHVYPMDGGKPEQLWKGELPAFVGGLMKTSLG